MVSDVEEGEDEVVQSHAGGSDDDEEGEDLLENAHACVYVVKSLYSIN